MTNDSPLAFSYHTHSIHSPLPALALHAPLTTTTSSPFQIQVVPTHQQKRRIQFKAAFGNDSKDKTGTYLWKTTLAYTVEIDGDPVTNQFEQSSSLSFSCGKCDKAQKAKFSLCTKDEDTHTKDYRTIFSVDIDSWGKWKGTLVVPIQKLQGEINNQPCFNKHKYDNTHTRTRLRTHSELLCPLPLPPALCLPFSHSLSRTRVY